MDNISNTQIAKLVLGYLKSENNQTTVDEFIRSSPYIKNENPKRIKYIVTRVLGKSLTEILQQYAEIYTIIQERLEETEYFNKQKYSANLVNQLTYLLDNKYSTNLNSPASVFEDSYSSTPIKNTCNNESIEVSNSDQYTTPNINATPLKNLPGHSVSVHTPHRTIQLPNVRSHRVSKAYQPDYDHLENEKSNTNEDDDRLENVINVFAQTLLDHEELHEKLANNINTVRHTELTSTSRENKHKENKQPNNTCTNDDIDSAIKAVLDKTESDPLFETLIGDIIGSINEKENKLKCDGNVEEKYKAEKRASLNKVIENIETVNKEAVESIVTTAQGSQCTNSTISANPNDIIMYDGTLDNFMKNSNGAAPPVQPNNVTPLVINPNTLLMMQPQQNSSFIQNNPMDSSKSYIFINVTPQPPTQYILTEQDILKMPTVIVQDEKYENKTKKSPPKIAPRKTRTSERRVKTLLPKQTKCEETLSDYIKTYNCNEGVDDNISEYEPCEHKSKRIPRIEIEIIEPEIIKLSPDSKKLISPTKTTESDKRPTSLNHILTPENNRKSKRSQSTPRSGNRSHVRALDFKFTTPAKQEIEVKKISASPKSIKKSPEKKNPSKTVKTLFSSPTKNKKNPGSWDTDLRALACGGPVRTRPLSPRKKKRKLQSKIKIETMNKTVEDAQKIEAALTLDSTLEKSPNENQNTLNKSTNDVEKSVKPKRRSRAKKSTNIRNPLQSEQIELKADAETSMQIVTEDIKPEKLFETSEIALINCNIKPNIYKKCNTDNNIRREVKVTKLKEIKSFTIHETTDKLILSPSKIHNASKRSILNIETIVVPQSNEINVSENKMGATNIFEEPRCIITPETIKKDSMIPPSSAKRNIIPILETPVKFDPCEHPKTPGFFSPVNTNDTPFTKVFKEHLQGVDISSIETPKFPLTPNFPFTPRMDQLQSPSNNRPTDYSTSSSYYQPSDTEQNKSLELMIKEECFKRMEMNKALQIEVQSDIPIRSCDDQILPHAVEVVSEDIASIQAEINNFKTKQIDHIEETHIAVAAKMKSLKNNVIGRKNLNLLKPQTSDEGSSTSGSDSDSDSNNTSSDASWTGNAQNDTVINTYPLRSKNKDSDKSVDSKENEPNNLEKETKSLQNIQNIISNAEFVPQLITKQIDDELSDKGKVLRELEEKKKRTIARIKGNDIAPIATPAVKKKTVPKVEKKATATKSKNVNSKKQAAKTPTRVPVRRNLRSNSTRLNTKSPEPETPATLHISSDEESLEPMRLVEVHLQCSKSNTPVPDDSNEHTLTSFEDVLEKNYSKFKSKDALNDTVAASSDQEAEKLVKGLKQWGIHLVHNKSPKCQKNINVNKSALEKLRKKQDLSIALVGKEDINKTAIQQKYILEKELQKELTIVEICKTVDNNDIKSKHIVKVPMIEGKENQCTGKIEKLVLEKVTEKVDVTVDEKEIFKPIAQSALETVAKDLELSLEDGEILTDDEKTDITRKDCFESKKIDLSKNKNNSNKQVTKYRQKTSDLKKYEIESKEKLTKENRPKTYINKRSQETQQKLNKTISDDKIISTCIKTKISRNDKVGTNDILDPKTTSKISENEKGKLVDVKTISVKDKPIKSGEELVTALKENIAKTGMTNNTTDSKDHNVSTACSTQDILESEIIFDIANIEEDEIIQLTHDKKYKSQTVYDPEVMEKNFEVEVFIDELEREEKIPLKISAFESLLDIPERINILMPKKKISINEYLKNRPISQVKNIQPLISDPQKNLQTKTQSLQNICNEKPTPQIHAQSQPLQNIHIDEKKSLHDDQVQTKPTSEKFCRQEINETTHLINKNQNNIETNLKVINENIRTIECKTTEVIHLHKKEKSSATEQEDELSESITAKADLLAVSMLRSGILIRSPSTPIKDEELMNFAICCSNSSNLIETDKRKHTGSESDMPPVAKRLKPNCQQLLKEVDVDDFLKRLHGDV